MPWLTRDEDLATVEVTVIIPGGEGHFSDLIGALLDLGRAENWEQFGDLTPDESANAWWAAIQLTMENNP